MTEREIDVLVGRLELLRAREAHLHSSLLNALQLIQEERDSLQVQLAKCEGGDEAKLLLSEDFAGEQLTSPYLTLWSSTPDAYTDCLKPFTTFFDNGTCTTCGHYFAQKDTNEKTPWEVTLGSSGVLELTGAETFSEFCIEWKEHFVAGYPWPTAGQKMLRVGYDHGEHPESKKTFDLACLNSGANMQAASYWSGGEVFKNSGEPHLEDEWVTWRVWMKLNTPGATDGFVRITRDGLPFIAGEGLKLRTDSDERGMNFFWIGGNYSMAGGVGGLVSDGHRYITGIRWWDTAPSA